MSHQSQANSSLRHTDEVLEDIKNLVASPGYIYPLLLIIFEDFHIDPEKLHEIDYWRRLNVNEASLLVGFLIQKPIDYTLPESWEALFELKKKTYELMQELHRSFHKSFFEKLQVEAEANKATKSFQDFFGQGEMLVEPIFYSGTGVYDFQYLDYLSKKYRYDQDWLKAKKGFLLTEAIEIFKKIKELLHEKSKRVHLYVSGNLEQMKEKAQKTYKGKDFDKDFQQVIDMAELHQYADLFFDESLEKLNPKSDEFREACRRVFYRNLVDLFTVSKTQLRELSGGEQFIQNFSIKIGDPLCSQLTGIGEYNASSSHPLIELDSERFLLPIPFVLSEAIYEAPFYWMMRDSAYRDTAAKNRGNAGEEIVFQLLSKVFGKKAYRRILVKTGSNQIETDVDVLCILGSKALCVQVKSKKLTLLSRQGDDQALQKDFQGAVQDAYEQAWIAREKILDKSSKLFDEHGTEVQLSEGIDDVYMLVVTTENYPSLAHQVHSLLKLKENSPAPLAFTAFDLEMVAHYLGDPYDFLYYIRQRISLINQYSGDEESTYLGYHLSRKLWKEEADWIALDTTWAQAIDRNYYPFKAGLQVSDEGDSIKARWKDDKFDFLCDGIKTLGHDKVTDIIFHLYDLSGSFRTNLVKLIQDTKKKTWADNRFHSVAIPPDESHEPRFGITYFSSETESLKEVEKRLLVLCNLRKYKSRADAWLGLGSVKSSMAPFDFIMYAHNPWVYDPQLEESCKLLPALVKSTYVNLRPEQASKKLGRNDPCHCGSGKKFKKCCLA